MSASDLRMEIIELVREEQNTTVLEAIRMLLRRQESDVDDDLSEQEVAELERRRARYLSGESKPTTAEESLRQAREGYEP